MDTGAQTLWTPHARPLTVLYADLEAFALQAREAFLGTAGSVIERKNASGVRFYAHQFYDAEGKQRERYLAGPVGSETADGKAQALRERIAEMKARVSSLRLLGREGFHLVDSRTYGTIASLHNHGVFGAGGMLVGSHAYGVLLNKMGVRAAPYATEDVDIGRREALAFNTLPEQSLLEMLRESGINLVEVPSLDRKRLATSFKRVGPSGFHVDLLVPSKDETFPVIEVPELRAFATGLPYLDYLLAESQMAMIMAREGCCAVRVPLPERFVVHKLVVSQLRVGHGAQASKDRDQAVILGSVLAERFPGALEDAKRQLPKRAGKYFKRAIEATKAVLEKRAPRALNELSV